MTEKEEAIIILDGFKDNPLFNEQHKKALDMAISALSESKGDLISRGEVQNVLHNNLHALIDTDQLYQLYKDINHLTTYSFPDPTEDNTTEWIDNGEDDLECHCKKCGQEIFKVQKWFKYCPNCGRKAVKKNDKNNS